MYINYKVQGGIEYAMVVTSVRKGVSVGKGDIIYLGRVIDKEHNIFKSRLAHALSFLSEICFCWTNT